MRSLLFASAVLLGSLAWRDPEPAADATLQSRQEDAQLHAAMRGLPKEQVRLVQLSYFEGKSQSEIASELELPLGTVKSRLRLALKKLRTNLGERD